MGGSDETRIVLLGKTGSGKSSLGNTILGDSLLKVKSSPNAETGECQAESKYVSGRLIKVVDTPGFFDNNMDEEKLRLEIIKSVKESAPGVHAFIIAMEVGRYTEQEKDIIRKIKEYFSDKALEHAVIVFTHGDQLPEGQTIKDYCRQNADLGNLVKKCGGRCHVVDNKYWKNNQHDEYRSNKFQVKQILNTVEKMKNNQGMYTNEFLQLAENPSPLQLLNILAGVAVGALLGAFFGAVIGLHVGKILGANPLICAGIGAAVGGVVGGVIGGSIGCNVLAVEVVVKETAEVVCGIGVAAVNIVKCVSDLF